MAETPLRKQYLEIKKQYPDTILFFRLGDFYEAFDDDAKLIARELEITLTRRPMSKGLDIPMAGVPHHAVEGKIAQLIAKGYKVAICDQLTEAIPGKLVEREVTQVVTPGTVVEPSMLEPTRNNYLAALWLEEKCAGFAYTDITTGEFYCTQFDEASPDELRLVLRAELERLAVTEILVPKKLEPRRLRPEMLFTDSPEDYLQPYRTLAQTLTLTPALTPVDGHLWQLETARACLQSHFEVTTLESFGCADLPFAIRVGGVIVEYLKETQKDSLARLSPLITYSPRQFMVLDPQTRRNLELAESGRRGSLKHSLFGVLNRTKTSMGARLLRRWMNQPLISLKPIQARQAMVAVFYDNPALREQILALLKDVQDLERLTSRSAQKRAYPPDLQALQKSLEIVPQLRRLLADLPDFGELLKTLHPCTDLVDTIARAIVDDPPKRLQQGHSDKDEIRKDTIRPGYNAELDQLRNLSRDSVSYIRNLERQEQARTGIEKLKVGYNSVFGYYIEVTKANLAKVPKEYIRKQTIVNGERFITPELKEYENIVLNASEKIEKLESKLFRELMAQVANQATPLLETATAIAQLDVFAALADVATLYNYTRPHLNDSTAIRISAGRHPVIEAVSRDSVFVPNDVALDSQKEQVIVLTGPNMAGKSTYIRQIALIVLMAQIGSFVPADNATIGIVDRIFTRVGAQDDIATGQSTFMVEMVETSYILSHSTPRSLIILDEVGRGTSTYDGLAIAQAVVEYIHNNPKCGAKTLFATHYHELIALAAVLPRVRNYNMAVTESGGKVVFLRKVMPGGADRSYGIHVAQLAGLPRSVIHRAEELLEKLEGEVPDHRPRKRKPQDNTAQMSLFTPSPNGHTLAPNPVLDLLHALKIEELSPLEAINKLYELQQLAKEPGGTMNDEQ
jgi:DNA mismatch repair protein MutS